MVKRARFTQETCMLKKTFWLKLAGAAVLLTAAAVRATDTAFWKPYAADADTLFLESFDGGGPGTVADGKLGAFGSHL
jgi:hypothetical protein